MTIETQIDAAVKAVCPIHGISLPSLADKSTWIIFFKDEATPTQRSSAQSVINAYDITVALQKETDLDTAISSDATLASLKAMTKDEFDAWWAANITTAAQAIGVLKRVVRLILRRIL